MKIVFISRYQGKVERGVENYTAELAPRLKKLGNKVEVLTSFWQLLRSDLQRSDLGRSDLTIIYPLNGYWQTLGCRLYAWAVGAKLVVGGHAGIGRDDRWNLYMFPDLFIAFSKKGEEWAKRVNPFVKIVKIPHGVNLRADPRYHFLDTLGLGSSLISSSPLGHPKSKVSPGSSSVVSKMTSSGQPKAGIEFNPAVRPVKLDLERPIVVTAAHLEPYKRVDLTVKAVAELKKGSLLVLGEGPMEKEIDELGEKLLSYSSGLPRPRQTGPRNDGKRKRYLRLAVRHDQVAGYLRAADVFTLVSAESEAFGLVYLEAMACNLPVVATDDSLRRELIGGAGVFVKNPADSQEYARCLEAAAKTDWGDRPVKQARKFDWGEITKEYNNLLSQLKTYE